MKSGEKREFERRRLKKSTDDAFSIRPDRVGRGQHDMATTPLLQQYPTLPNIKDSRPCRALRRSGTLHSNHGGQGQSQPGNPGRQRRGRGRRHRPGNREARRKERRLIGWARRGTALAALWVRDHHRGLQRDRPLWNILPALHEVGRRWCSTGRRTVRDWVPRGVDEPQRSSKPIGRR